LVLGLIGVGIGSTLRGGFCHWHPASNDGNVVVPAPGCGTLLLAARILRADLLKQHVALPTH
jgi:hypothetical protein